MTIDYTRLRNLTARRLIKALEEDGFFLRRQKGSHRRFNHPDGRRVTVTFHHSGDTFPIGTLRSMIERQAKWSETDLLRLDLHS
jgi:predicted RNA binding protein YcfA (HicA-like mRNA interferase family)